MKIHNPNNLPTISYDLVQDLQENLKDLNTEEHDKLLHILETRGFDIPLFIWFDGKTPYLCDGHQRVRTMKLNELTDNGSREVPYIEIKAKDKKEAVARLLEITSQFGKTTREGLDELAGIYELETDEMDIHFDAIVDFDPTPEPDEEEEVEHEKPTTKKYSIKELRAELHTFETTQGLHDNGFVEWLDR